MARQSLVVPLRPAVRRTTVPLRAVFLASAAFAFAACRDNLTGPSEGAARSPTPQLEVTAAQGGEPTHLGILPGDGSGLVQQGAAAGSDIPGQYIVVLKENLVDAAGRTIDAASLAGQMVAANGGTLRFNYTSALKGFAAKLSDQAVARLKHDPTVAYIEPDRVIHAATTQHMDLFGQPWGLDRIDERTAPATWSGTYTYNATGRGVYAYVFDTGLRVTHPEFGVRAKNVYDAFGGSGNDCNGHGTHVAGTVGGKTFGVAKGVLLRGVRVLNCQASGSTSAFIAAVDWVIRNHLNPAVANMSLGARGVDAAVNTAVTRLVNSGVFVAVAAGNNSIGGENACNWSPASAPALFTTAASTYFDLAAIFTNTGPCVDAYAPGNLIKSASLTNPNGETMDGTSMATPHVTGVAALIRQHFPNYSPAAITSWIKNNATRNVIVNNTTGTPNRVLYKGRL